MDSNIYSGKVLVLVSGIVVLGLSVHNQSGTDLYHLCLKYDYVDKKCPHNTTQHFFLATVIGCFILSLLNLVSEYYIDLKSGFRQVADIGYHLLATILMLLSAILYLIDTVQLNNILEPHRGTLNLGYTEKIVAGSFAIIQTFMYAIMTMLIVKRDPDYSPV